MPEAIFANKREISLRLANLSDAASICAIGSHTFSTTFGYSLPPADLEAYLQNSYSLPAITADLTNPSITTIVAYSSSAPSTVVGFAQLTEGTSEPCIASSENAVELQRLYVSPEWHGTGAGKLLIKRMEELAREKGFKTLWLGVWEENLKAQGVYGRMGFEKCGMHDFVMGSCVQTDWIMKKCI